MDHRQIHRAWETFVGGGPVAATVRKTVGASWQRSRDHDVRIRRAMAPLAQEAEIYRHRSECATLVNAARPVFGRTSALLSEADAMLILTDTTGMVLETQGDERVIDAGRAIHLEHGGSWREADIGTNAIGTAVAMARPVQILGAEHFCLEIQKWSCAASPVRHPVDRTILGVVDISAPAEKFIPQSLALAVSISHHIEDLIAHSVSLDRERLLQRSMLKMARWTSEEMVVVDRRGAIVHASHHALGALHQARGDVVVDGAIPMLRTVAPSRWPEAVRDWLPHASVEIVGDDATSIGAIIVLRAPRDVAFDRIRPGTKRACENAEAAPCRSNEGRRQQMPPTPAPEMVAADPNIRTILHRVERAAARAMPILVLGETGTGKEQLARHAHVASGRKGTFVPVNCAALPESLAEAELFGYADGAFTGARRGGAIGLAKQADGGTLFLDEIGDMPVALQAILLRFLDDMTVRPIGGAGSRVDVFLVSATNVPLEAAIAAGRFRSDLLYRLNTLEVNLPRLCERSDFGEITRHLLAGIDPARTITTAAIDRLKARPWPGNIRELRNILTRLTLLAEAEVLDEDAVSIHLASEPSAITSPDPLQGTGSAQVLSTHASVGGNISEVARRLGISRNTVYRILERAGVHRGAA